MEITQSLIKSYQQNYNLSFLHTLFCLKPLKFTLTLLHLPYHHIVTKTLILGYFLQHIVIIFNLVFLHSEYISFMYIISGSTISFRIFATAPYLFMTCQWYILSHLIEIITVIPIFGFRMYSHQNVSK